MISHQKAEDEESIIALIASLWEVDGLSYGLQVYNIGQQFLNSHINRFAQSSSITNQVNSQPKEDAGKFEISCLLVKDSSTYFENIN